MKSTFKPEIKSNLTQRSKASIQSYRISIEPITPAKKISIVTDKYTRDYQKRMSLLKQKKRQSQDQLENREYLQALDYEKLNISNTKYNINLSIRQNRLRNLYPEQGYENYSEFKNMIPSSVNSSMSEFYPPLVAQKQTEIADLLENYSGFSRNVSNQTKPYKFQQVHFDKNNKFLQNSQMRSKSQLVTINSRQGYDTQGSIFIRHRNNQIIRDTSSELAKKAFDQISQKISVTPISPHKKLSPPRKQKPKYAVEEFNKTPQPHEDASYGQSQIRSMISDAMGISCQLKEVDPTIMNELMNINEKFLSSSQKDQIWIIQQRNQMLTGANELQEVIIQDNNELNRAVSDKSEDETQNYSFYHKLKTKVEKKKQKLKKNELPIIPGLSDCQCAGKTLKERIRNYKQNLELLDHQIINEMNLMQSSLKQTRK